ncbi:MAG: sel1 repeat family protein [Opitutales bacterium]|nr:sel1 repeat family protein [Opitutales bacterium]
MRFFLNFKSLLVLFLWGTFFMQGILGQSEPGITIMPPEQDAEGDAILDADAQFDLGDMYFEGYGVAQNFEKAAEWFRNAAQQGHAKAQAGLGYLYHEGKGVSQDYSEAIKWLRKAAEQGHVEAQAGLGFIYFEGRGTSQDYSEAVKWLRKAAEQTDAEAQFGLGYMYFKGKGGPQDYSEAAKWFRKAAEQEYDLALFYLGDMYFQGRGVTQNYEEAATWFRKAAEQGLGSAQKRTEFKIVEDRSGTEFFLEATGDIDTVMVRELDTGEEIFRGFLGEGMRLRLHRKGPVRITTSAGEFLRIEEGGERFQFPSKGRGATVFPR